MIIANIGASGRTGVEFTRAALAAQHDVVAVVRDPQRLTVPAGQVRQADATEPAALSEALQGVDVVVWSVGHGRETGPAVMAVSIAATIQAMDRVGLRRLVAVTASGPFTAGDNPLSRYVAKPILWGPLGPVWRDMVAAEDVIQASTLDWTILRPPQLKDGPARGRYHSRRDLNVRWGFTIRRADLARAMLDVIEDPSTVRHAVSVAR